MSDHSEDAWIRTFTGGKVYFFEPSKSNIEIEDVIHPLSLLCRFNGSSLEFYSVAQHSVLVADNVFKETGCKNTAYSALLHDASEAFISDIPSPFKTHFPGFKEIEIKMEEWLSQRFHFKYPFDPIIKHHDLRCLSTEMRDLMLISDHKNLPNPYEEKIIPLGWREARQLLLTKFKEYSPNP